MEVLGHTYRDMGLLKPHQKSWSSAWRALERRSARKAGFGTDVDTYFKEKNMKE